MSNPVRGYAMSYSELRPGEVIADHLLLQFPGDVDRIATGLTGILGWFPEGDGGQCNQDIKVGSLRESVGIPFFEIQD